MRTFSTGSASTVLTIAIALFGTHHAKAADLADVIARVMPSVVYVRLAPPARKPIASPEIDQETQDLFRRFMPAPGASGQRPNQDGSSIGTGMVVSPEGHVLTAEFVISHEAPIEVELHDRRVFDARVVGSDRARGVTLLKIEANGLTPVRFAQGRAPRVGDRVFAIGAPYRMPRTVTEGIVSRLDAEPAAFIQTTASINPGSGGGPLFDMAGEVIGMNHSIYSRTGAFQGISFVVPAATVVRAHEELRATGRTTRGSIGVTIADVDGRTLGTAAPTLPPGVLLREVDPGGLADKAGLRVGDIVIRVEGQAIQSTGQLIALIRDARIGSSVRMDLVREGRQRSVNVEVGRAPER